MTTIKALRNLAAIVVVAAAGFASFTVPALRSQPNPAASTAVHAPLDGQSASGGDVADVVVALNGSAGTGAPRTTTGERLVGSSAMTPSQAPTMASPSTAHVALHSRPAAVLSASYSPKPVPTHRPQIAASPSQRPVATGKGLRGWHTAYASSYGIGDGFLGNRLACGGRLDNVTLVVAHRTLPCGTRLTVCFTRSSGTYCSAATVRDRGPYCCGAPYSRSFDLGPAVARAVHFAGLGTIAWRLG